jgi:hypothetical protein
LNFINTPKASTHYGEYFYDVSCAAVAVETKKGGFKIILDSFHQTSRNCVGVSTVVWGAFEG